MAKKTGDGDGKANLGVRVPVEIIAKLDMIADAERRSRSAIIVFALEEYVAKHETPKRKRGE